MRIKFFLCSRWSRKLRSLRSLWRTWSFCRVTPQTSSNMPEMSTVTSPARSAKTSLWQLANSWPPRCTTQWKYVWAGADFLCINFQLLKPEMTNRKQKRACYLLLWCLHVFQWRSCHFKDKLVFRLEVSSLTKSNPEIGLLLFKQNLSPTFLQLLLHSVYRSYYIHTLSCQALAVSQNDFLRQ